MEPARLRIGPDWLAYAGNWLAQWERTADPLYRRKIEAGMRSILALPSGLFTGPAALGYDPATGLITTECDSTLQSTNHLMTIMGGFEVMTEIMRALPMPQWQAEWTRFASLYKPMALKIRHNRFRVSRLQAYAAWQLQDPALAADAWADLLADPWARSTNSAALWLLDAIYMQEVIPLK